MRCQYLGQPCPLPLVVPPWPVAAKKATAQQVAAFVNDASTDSGPVSIKAACREITLARWEQVDWTQRVLRVPVSKSGRPRTIALNTGAMAVLKSIPRDPALPLHLPNPPYRHLRPLGPHPTPRRTGGRPPADLRHSFASLLVNRGVSLYVVQGLLGHASPRMTQRYAHLAPQTLLDAAEMVSSVIYGPSRRVTAGSRGPSQAKPRT